MANILFKRGLKSNLAAASIVDGNVYVTTDEGAMYVDVGNSRVRLGDFKEYATLQALTSKQTSELDTQALYYITDGNMLIKWTGDPTDANGGWVQINSQSTLNALIGQIATSSSAVTGGVSVTQTIRDSNLGVAATSQARFVSADTDKLVISGANDTTNGYATITFTPDSIVENTTVSVSNDTLNNNTVNLTLTNTKTGTTAGGTTVNDSTNTSTLAIEGDGIIVSESQGKLVLTNSGGITAINESFNSSGALSVNITTTGNSLVAPTTTVTPTITYGDTGASSAVFVSGTAALSVYTKSEVDTKISAELKAINAMTFKGTIGTNVGDVSTDLPTSNVSNGDVYKVSSAGDYNNNLQAGCKVGDMFIATGTEGNDGYIPANSLDWSYIPSGDDEVITYSFRYNSTSGAIELVNNNGSAVSSITVGTDLTASGSGTSLTISHDTVTRTNTTGTAQSSTAGSNFTFNVITGITTSSTGHITGVETTAITVNDTSNSISNVSATPGTLAGTGSNSKITVSVTDSYSTQSAEIKLHSDSLTLTPDTTNQRTNIDFVWGTF